MYIEYLDTPVGVIEVKASCQGVTHVVFSESPVGDVRANDITRSCRRQLKEYFDGRRKVFDLLLDLQGTTFQKSIWDCLAQIPYGQVASYSDVAKMINNPKAVRAVGAANGKNPIGIIVPCHRVIGRNGTLTGYAGGVERKAWLLKHEGIELRG